MPKKNPIQFDVITIFPETVEPYVEASILGRAQKKNLIKIGAHNLRDWAKDKHRKVDDTPYGGGAGMVMKVEPFDLAVRKVKKKNKKVRVIMTAASGTMFTQKDAKRLAKYDQLIFLCGRYEGIDARVERYIADESLSIGPYVLTGGELPSMVMIDSVARMVPGVISEESLRDESHTEEGSLEYPQYTKPAVYKMKDTKLKKGYRETKVPDVLLSGDHKKIDEWRQDESNKKTI